MSDTAYKIATEIMLKMVDAIEKKDRGAFRECLEDGRIHNCIVGYPGLKNRYCSLCMRALDVFI